MPCSPRGIRLGLGGRTRTGILVGPGHARFQLRYTQLQSPRGELNSVDPGYEPGRAPDAAAVAGAGVAPGMDEVMSLVRGYAYPPRTRAPGGTRTRTDRLRKPAPIRWASEALQEIRVGIGPT